MDDEALHEIEGRAEKAINYIADLCQGKRTWTMTVPVDLSRDDDVVLGAVVGDVRQLVAEVRRLREDLDRAHDARIEAQNIGIDMEQVRAERAERRAG